MSVVIMGRLEPLLAALEQRGPLTKEQIGGVFRDLRASTLGEYLKKWRQAGYIAKRDDDRYVVGPVKPCDRKGHLPAPADETGVEDSDQWLVVSQLAHGPLFTEDVKEILDASKEATESVLRGLQKLGYVRKVVNGPWQLVRRVEAAG